MNNEQANWLCVDLTVRTQQSEHYWPVHARVSVNEQAEKLASTAGITFGLQLGRAEVL